ncbi:hypothetical protein [Geofilum rubicundum]|uniref:Sensor protein n=1 Tax=Geofilum rubicundum JCM 15548 TaxID=1236989 RepID=A0A0E9LXY2_9BACT|nr:hypothetical protein [Geofilum rubicundum]GAO29735.1 sensor protein [Geofilum rubicundum JCM 15548]
MTMSSYWPYLLLIACIVVFTGVMILSFKGLGYKMMRAEQGLSSRLSLSRRLKSLRIILAVFGSLILAIGLGGAYFEVQRVRDNRYQELETIAQSVANGFSYELIAPLTFTESDTSNAAYGYISHHLEVMAGHYDHVQIYTMVMRDSLIVFGPCSPAHNQYDTVLPGEIYQHPPEGLSELFSSGRSLILDPYKDEFGYYISAFAPVLHPLSSAPAIMIGVDMEAEQFDIERAMAPFVHWWSLWCFCFYYWAARFISPKEVSSIFSGINGGKVRKPSLPCLLVWPLADSLFGSRFLTKCVIAKPSFLNPPPFMRPGSTITFVRLAPPGKRLFVRYLPKILLTMRYSDSEHPPL